MNPIINGTRNRTILLISGGPGFPSVYLEPIANYYKTDYEIVTYAPLFEIESDYSIEKAIIELEQVLETGCTNDIVILGHSFGGYIALNYFLSKKSSKKVSGLICSNTTYSFKKYSENLQNLRGKLPEDLNRQFQRFEIEENFGEVFFDLFMREWAPKHWCKVPFPPELSEALAQFNPSIYGHFLGENLLDLTGTLICNSSLDLTNSIDVPSLFICGDEDVIFEEDVLMMAKETNGSHFVCARSAHFPFFENPRAFFKRTDSFLNSL